MTVVIVTVVTVTVVLFVTVVIVTVVTVAVGTVVIVTYFTKNNLTPRQQMIYLVLKLRKKIVTKLKL